MPELPEVETFRRYLVGAGIEGARVQGVDLRWPKAVQSPSPEELVSGLPGRRIERLERRGKYLLFRLDHGALVVHLRMTGSLQVAPACEPHRPFVRTVFNLDGGRELRFADARKLGMLWLVEDPGTVVKGLGPEPLLLPDLSPDPVFTLDHLVSRLRGRRAPVKSVLMDQAVVAGMGNLYADETLFAAGIHPARLAGDLAESEVESLHRAIPEVLAEAVRALAVIIPALARGEVPWEAQLSAPHALKVPRLEKAACPRCGAPVSRGVVGGRGTYFCFHCQPIQPR